MNAKILAGSALVGMQVRAEPSRGAAQSGIIEYETKNMITLRTRRGSRMVAKRGSLILFETDDGTVKLDGDSIAKRPHERIGTVSGGGRGI